MSARALFRAVLRLTSHSCRAGVVRHGSRVNETGSFLGGSCLGRARRHVDVLALEQGSAEVIEVVGDTCGWLGGGGGVVAAVAAAGSGTFQGRGGAGGVQKTVEIFRCRSLCLDSSGGF